MSIFVCIACCNYLGSSKKIMNILEMFRPSRLPNLNFIKFTFMLKQRMKAVKCPSDELAITNCALVNPDDFPSDTK